MSNIFEPVCDNQIFIHDGKICHLLDCGMLPTYIFISYLVEELGLFKLPVGKTVRDCSLKDLGIEWSMFRSMNGVHTFEYDLVA